ncbi:hypothetical protein RIF29_01980 [Crotalaria pallida]|uniref:Uncharacterized protein n=1 Tax=Crotalaria pallida TaxID=3830 RepID=A0AAN9J031_CROPI
MRSPSPPRYSRLLCRPCSVRVRAPISLSSITQAKSSCNEELKELRHWMKPEKVINKNNNDNKLNLAL